MSKQTYSILIVDDELDIVNALQYNLNREGFTTQTASSGQVALDLVAGHTSFDLIILDLMLPDMRGTDVCRTIKTRPKSQHIPVIMLTARSEEIDRIVGFEMGADDYVVKPFSIRELLLRIRAILKRAEHTQDAHTPQEFMRFGPLHIDIVAHRVWVDNEDVRLTALEFRLLTTFLTRKGRVQTRDVLLGDVWGIHADVTTRTVDTHVKRLREKLGVAGQYIETLRGVGYRFWDQPSVPPHSQVSPEQAWVKH